MTIDSTDVSNDTLERLRNITQMFSGRVDEHQQLQKVERFMPSEKIKNTFQKFQDIGLSNGQLEDEDDDDDNNNDTNSQLDGIIRSRRIKKPAKEHIPYHEMAEVKDKFEKGLIDSNKPRVEKRLDVRVQSGLTSSKKQAFEQGEFEQETEPHFNKIQIETDLVAGLTSSKKQAFQQQQMENETNTMNKTIITERDALVGVATAKKAKFESGQLSDRPRISICPDEIATIVGAGLAQAKRSELLSKIDAEQQIQRSSDRFIDIDAEQGLATTRRDQLASLANSEFKSTEKSIDVTAGLATAIKEQYIADASKATSKISVPMDDIQSGMTKNRTTAFEKLDETTVKRTVDIDSELRERGVAKERVAMFKNLENGTQSSTTTNGSGDTKLRIDENGNVVRESDKSEEIYFEKGQTKQLVEQWKTKQISPDRDSSDAQIIPDTESVQQGKAKNLVQMWKSIDKENTPPSERRGLRAFTPPTDNERRMPPPDDEEINSQKINYTEDKTNIEAGYAKAARERLLQTAEQNNTISKRKTLKQFTPPPESPNNGRRKSITPPTDNLSMTEHYTNNEEIVSIKGQTKSLKNRFVELEQDALKVETASSKIKYVPKRFVVCFSSMTEHYTNNEEIVSIKGQTKSLKNRFVELEQDALKVETASSKIKYVPKRFVSTPAPKQNNSEPMVDSTKCSACNKTVYAMEKIEADKKVYHKSCFKCMHCKAILKLGNYTANDGQIYCKPHFLQLFAIKGNYSAGFGLDDHKTRWLPLNSQESTSFNED
ncbi:unnamed protein product [Adineta steineri]|uniref:LIM zinc-binding domain-containing protein n=1 Tax=Adineta steineri TaxID=433720 RepID=A0A814IRY9_9BILA|nr:unnamed protein product [Adineta steineri]